MSGVSVSSEMTDVATTFDWSWDDVQTVTERALAAAFLSDSERCRLLTDVVRPGYAALRDLPRPSFPSTRVQRPLAAVHRALTAC
jgi:adenosine deaminase